MGMGRSRLRFRTPTEGGNERSNRDWQDDREPSCCGLRGNREGGAIGRMPTRCRADGPGLSGLAGLTPIATSRTSGGHGRIGSTRRASGHSAASGWRTIQGADGALGLTQTQLTPRLDHAAGVLVLAGAELQTSRRGAGR